MDHRSAEVRTWHVLGMAFLIGGGLPLGLNAVHIASTRLVESDALELAVGYSVIILLGFIALVLARVLSAKDGVQHEHLDWIWTVLAWVAMPMGAAIFDLEWGRAAFNPVTLDEKATLLAGGFIFMTGLISLLGERAVHRIQCSTIRRTLNGVEQRVSMDATRGPVH